MSAPVISAKSLVKTYPVKGKPDFVAVDGLDFEVAPGESFGLFGRWRSGGARGIVGA